MRRFLALLALLAAPALAQPIRVPPVRTIATLGACVAGKPRIAAVTDALTVADCTVGGGSVTAMCACRPPLDWTPFGNAGSGTVRSVAEALSGLPWLAISGSPVTDTGTITLAPAGGQAPGLVLGTCGSATSVGLCALTPGMIPSLAYLPTPAGTPSGSTFARGDGQWAIPPTNTGPQGDPGPTGAQGPIGSTGVDGAAGSDGIPKTIQDEGSALTQRLNLNFVGAGVTCIDNSGSSRTDCTIPGSSGVSLQGSTPGTPDTGNLNVSGAAIIANVSIGSGSISAPGLTISTPGNSFMALTVTGDQTMYFGTKNTTRLTINQDGALNNQGNIATLGATSVSVLTVTCGAVGTCGSGQKGTQRCAADGTLCWCNGTIWTATAPVTGSCI